MTSPTLYRYFNKRLRRAGLLHSLLCQARMRPFGLQPAEHMLLMRIAREEGNLSQKELAKKMELSTAAIAVSLKKLEAGGYVARCADTDDSRINRVTVTEKGLLTAKESRILFDALDTEMFAGVSEEELDLCLTTMEKLITNIKNALGAEQE